jgi:peptidyl-Lys metalloendopeptidase
VVTDVDDFVIQTKLINSGDESLTLLNDPNSILTPSLKTNVFGIVATGGSSAKFNGMKVKWKPQIAIRNQEFTVLEPGESVELAQDLSGVYDLTKSGPGGEISPDDPNSHS